MATKLPKTPAAALHALCDALGLRGLGASLEAELARAQRLGSPVEEVLARLLTAEDCSCQQRSLDYRIRQAKLPWDWTLETFPFALQPGVRKAHILSLADLSFLARTDNIVFIGDPGTGKTGLAVGLLRKALQNGHRGLFIKAQTLLDELYASLADRSTTRLIRRLSRIEVLVIDELGYLSLQPEQVNAFFQLMDQRYARTSTILTTNIEYPNWFSLFGRKPLVNTLQTDKNRKLRRNSASPSTVRQGASGYALRALPDPDQKRSIHLLQDRTTLFVDNSLWSTPSWTASNTTASPSALKALHFVSPMLPPSMTASTPDTPRSAPAQSTSQSHVLAQTLSILFPTPRTPLHLCAP